MLTLRPSLGSGLGRLANGLKLDGGGPTDEALEALEVAELVAELEVWLVKLDIVETEDDIEDVPEVDPVQKKKGDSGMGGELHIPSLTTM